MSQEFSKEDDIPDLNGTKVYDFVMSKEKTLPHKLSPDEIQRLKKKWICIGSLTMSSLIVIIIVIVVLVITSNGGDN